jgi:ferric-dicitrate binding protein FerR (iron transport regulator)
MTETEYLQLQAWLHDLEEGQLDVSSKEAMEALLLRSEAARKHMVRQLGLSGALCKFADEAQESQEADGDNLLPMAKAAKKTWPLSAKLALAASLVLTGCAVALTFSKPANLVTPGIAEAQDGGCAVLVDAAGAQWPEGSKAWQVGMAVPAGKLALKAGLVRLEFYSGASLTLEGNSELDIVSVKEARCQFGQMRVKVPPHARGFRLTTPDAKVVDLGTEFGLKVNPSGASEVHVFDGEVEVYPDSGNDKLSLKQGATWNAANGANQANANTGAFADLAAMRAQSRDDSERRLQTWREGMKAFFTDPALLVGYAFETENDWDRTLRNLNPKAEEFSHGSIVGARWTQGRWQGKRALEFKSPGDRVRLSVPGDYEAITLAAWVQVGGVDRRFNSLFLTDRWAAGSPHWQFIQDGSFVLGVHAAASDQGQHVFYSPPIFGPENLGVWFHLATTFDLHSRIGKHYVNGRLVHTHEEAKIVPETRIRIGNGELGNWGLPEDSKPRTEVRSFNGKMDEFLLFGRVLNAAEIARIHELGKPN